MTPLHILHISSDRRGGQDNVVKYCVDESKVTPRHRIFFHKHADENNIDAWDPVDYFVTNDITYSNCLEPDHATVETMIIFSTSCEDHQRRLTRQNCANSV